MDHSPKKRGEVQGSGGMHRGAHTYRCCMPAAARARRPSPPAPPAARWPELLQVLPNLGQPLLDLGRPRQRRELCQLVLELRLMGSGLAFVGMVRDASGAQAPDNTTSRRAQCQLPRRTAPALRPQLAAAHAACSGNAARPRTRPPPCAPLSSGQGSSASRARPARPAPAPRARALSPPRSRSTSLATPC